MRIRLDISYDGGGFSGWANQPDRRTVQGELESTLATVLRTPVALTVAGRTDAGVHATGQVAHFDAVDVPERLLGRLNRMLPPDVRITGLQPVTDDFDARFAALWRRYEYVIVDSVIGVPPLQRGHVLGWPRELDEHVMAAAGAALVGLNDFAAFCKRREGATTIRTLLRFDVSRCDDRIVCTVTADAFCHSMVRSLVGALLAVGEGRRPVDWPAGLLTNGRRSSDVSVAPAHGLTLVEVGYPDDDDLAARTTQTRARRDET